MTNCKQQIEERNKKIKDIQERILSKEEALNSKQADYTRLTVLASQKFEDPTRKLKSVKNDLRKLRNEKLALEEYEQECHREMKKLNKSAKDLKRKNQIESMQVKNLESRVGKITEQMNSELKKHSAVESSVVKLKTFLKKEKETKDKFLQQVNTRKKIAGNYRYSSDTKTIKPVDWNKIEGTEQSPSYVSKHSWIDEKSVDTLNEESKIQKSIDDSDSHVDVSFISFDAD